MEECGLKIQIFFNDSQVLVSAAGEIDQNVPPCGSSSAWSSTQATAWEDSSAGMIPSSLVSVWKAFKAEASQITP